MTRAIRTEGLFPYVPRPLGAAFEGRLFVEEFVQAEEFTPSLLAGRVDPEVIASRLRSLHA
ncbi:MAG TPA: hypothetical protein VHH32_06510, partial [Gemmatimonadales bacterium]|nr:hypothetical protein [Gemmatimonadales bacterium]